MKRKLKDFIVDPKGQWNHPGKKTYIPNANGSITMRGVPYPVLGIDDQGNQQMMYPGQEYQFPGNSVYEIPMAQKGLQTGKTYNQLFQEYKKLQEEVNQRQQEENEYEERLNAGLIPLINKDVKKTGYIPQNILEGTDPVTGHKNAFCIAGVCYSLNQATGEPIKYFSNIDLQNDLKAKKVKGRYLDQSEKGLKPGDILQFKYSDKGKPYHAFLVTKLHEPDENGNRKIEVFGSHGSGIQNYHSYYLDSKNKVFKIEGGNNKYMPTQVVKRDVDPRLHQSLIERDNLKKELEDAYPSAFKNLKVNTDTFNPTAFVKSDNLYNSISESGDYDESIDLSASKLDEILTQFSNPDFKKNFMKQQQVSNDEYDAIVKNVVGIYGAESKFGTGYDKEPLWLQKHFGALTDSIGPFQINPKQLQTKRFDRKDFFDPVVGSEIAATFLAENLPLLRSRAKAQPGDKHYSENLNQDNYLEYIPYLMNQQGLLKGDEYTKEEKPGRLAKFFGAEPTPTPENKLVGDSEYNLRVKDYVNKLGFQAIPASISNVFETPVEEPQYQSGGTFDPETDEFIGFTDELPKAQEGLEKKGFNALSESQKALLQKGNNLDKVKGWYEQNPEAMQNFQGFMNEHNADDYLNLYTKEQKNFDTANKNNAEWHKQWYAKRAQLPQFKDVATQRLNSYSNLDSAKLIDPVNYAFKYWAANNASAFKDKNLPPETFYFPTDKLYGHQSDTDNEINVNAKLFNEGNYNVNNKLYNQTLSHETNHQTEDMFPQEGTVNHLNKSSWKNRDIIKDPIQNILTYDDILKDTRTNGGSDVYQYQPTEVRSRLDIWRQYNNIDALKDYSDEEIRAIMAKNMSDPNVPRNIKELYKTIQETPSKLKYLHNSYVSNDQQSPLDKFLPQGDIQKAQTGLQTESKTRYVRDANDPMYKKYMAEKRLSQFSNLPYNHKNELLLRDENFLSKLTNNVSDLSDEEWKSLLTPSYPELSVDPTEGQYGQKIEYGNSKSFPTSSNFPGFGDIYYNWNGANYKTDTYDLPSFLKQYPPNEYETKAEYSHHPIGFSFASKRYTAANPNTDYRKPYTAEVEDNTDLAELQKVYPKLTKEQLLDLVTNLRPNPYYQTNIPDSNFSDQTRDIYNNGDLNSVPEDKQHDINYLNKRGYYYPEGIGNLYDRYLNVLPKWNAPTDTVELMTPDLVRKGAQPIPIEEDPLKLNLSTPDIPKEFKPSRVLLREMGNIKRFNNSADGIIKEPYKNSHEVYMDDKKGWRKVTPEEYEYLRKQYPGSDKSKGWTKPIKKAQIGLQTGYQKMVPASTTVNSNLRPIDVSKLPQNTSNVFQSTFKTPYQELEALNQAAQSRYVNNMSSVDKWPELSGKTVNLTTDRYRGANVPVEYIDMLTNSAKRFKIDPYLLYAIAGRESTFGQGLAKNKERQISPINIVSGWNIAENYSPYDYERFLADNKTPNIKVNKSDLGYTYGIEYGEGSNALNEMNNYIKKRDLVNQYKKKLESTPQNNYSNPYDFLSEFIIKNGIEKYNPKDPDYKNKINKEIALLKKDPEFSKYVNNTVNRTLVNKQKGGTFNPDTDEFIGYSDELDKYQKKGQVNSYPSTAMTYNDNRSFYDSHAIIPGNKTENDPRYNDWVKKMVYEGKIAYDPTTGKSYPLNNKISVPEGRAERATTGYTKKSVDERLRTNKDARKDAVMQSMIDVGNNPAFYAPGAIATGALASGYLPAIGRGVIGGLSQSLPGMSGVAGATYGNLLGSYAATDALVNRIPQIPGQLSRGEYGDAAANTAMSGLDLYGANMISPLAKNAGKLFREQIYNAVDPVGYGVREKILRAPKTWARNTFYPNRRLEILQNDFNPWGLKEDKIRMAKNRLDSWRLGLGLDQKYDTFRYAGDNTYAIKNMKPRTGSFADLYSDILANEVAKRGFIYGDDALVNIARRNELAKAKSSLGPASFKDYYSRLTRNQQNAPWKQMRIVEPAKNSKFTHSVYDNDFDQGIMGNYRWDVNKLDDGNIHFQSNDTWDINPWEKRGSVNLDNTTPSPGYRKWNPFSNLEFLKAVGGKPFNIQNNFTIDPKTFEIIDSFKKGGSFNPNTDEFLGFVD